MTDEDKDEYFKIKKMKHIWKKCLAEELNTYFSQYCIMKLYVCLTGIFLTSWGLVGLEPVLISGF